mmetsp:Transcript_37701/g.87054  ORF Transcript_37701/g.87054 Transcript_37701/m.87054 type:complete len:502 (-) Transcript_37701:43-1548(-)
MGVASKYGPVKGSEAQDSLRDTLRQSVSDRIDKMGYGRYQFHCMVLCSGFVATEASLLTMVASLRKTIGASLGEESHRGQAMLIASLFVGLSCGTLVSGLLADPYGRRIPMLLGYLGMTFTAIALASCPPADATMHALLFLLGTYAGSGMAASVITLAEVCPAKWRGWSAAVLGISFSVGELWSGLGLLMFSPYLFNAPWRELMLWAAAPALGMLIFGYISPVSRHDTAVWLAANDRMEEVEACINTMAKMNDRPELQFAVDEFLPMSFASVVDGKASYRKLWHDVLSLLRPPVSSRLFCLSAMFFAKDFTFYGMGLFWPMTWRHFHTNEIRPAMELCATALLGAPGVWVAMYLIPRMSTRIALAGMAISCSVACLLLTYMNSTWILGMVGAVLFKVSFPTWQMTNMLLPAETFPTEVRGVAYSMVAFCGRVATVLAPLVICQSSESFLYITSVMACGSAVAVFMLPPSEPEVTTVVAADDAEMGKGAVSLEEEDEGAAEE